jgi:hypothetical protein
MLAQSERIQPIADALHRRRAIKPRVALLVSPTTCRWEKHAPQL